MRTECHFQPHETALSFLWTRPVEPACGSPRVTMGNAGLLTRRSAAQFVPIHETLTWLWRTNRTYARPYQTRGPALFRFRFWSERTDALCLYQPAIAYEERRLALFALYNHPSTAFPFHEILQTNALEMPAVPSGTTLTLRWPLLWLRWAYLEPCP